MDEKKLIELFDNSITLKEICEKLYGVYNENSRKKLKNIFNSLNYNWAEHIIKVKKLKTKYCLNCQKELKKGQHKFCSTSCAATFNGAKRKPLSEESKNKISIGLKKYYYQEKKFLENFFKNQDNVNNDIDLNLLFNEIQPHFCKFCGEKLKNSKTDFCNNDCKKHYYESEYRKYIERWKNGEERGYTDSLQINKKIRRYLFEKNHNACELCGWNKMNPYTNRIPLQIHHIDGDCTNNKEENLQLLCPNCHSLSDNYGSTNKNSKREYRKQKLNKT